MGGDFTNVRGGAYNYIMMRQSINEQGVSGKVANLQQTDFRLKRFLLKVGVIEPILIS